MLQETEHLQYFSVLVNTLMLKLLSLRMCLHMKTAQDGRSKYRAVFRSCYTLCPISSQNTARHFRKLKSVTQKIILYNIIRIYGFDTFMLIKGNGKYLKSSFSVVKV